MLYNQPYGITDTDAPYINGNPATGTMGSIPPAHSIEHPQREIVNFIKDSALIPSAVDLHQLGKSVQSGMVNWALDEGVVNDIQINPIVPIDGYHVGQYFRIKMLHLNSSQVTVNVNGVGRVPLVHTDSTPLNAYELLSGQLIEIAYDGANFQLMAGGAPGGIVTMVAPRVIYVDDLIGSDTLYDGTSSTIQGEISGPFKTIPKALLTMQQYNLGGWTFTIKVADGNYVINDPIYCPLPNGSGNVMLSGNRSNPAACQIFNANTGSCMHLHQGGNYFIDGFQFRATASRPGDPAGGTWAMGATTAYFGNNFWASMPGPNMFTGPSGYSFIYGNHTIVGNCQCHEYAFGNGVSYENTGSANPADDPHITIANPVTMTAFVLAADGGQVRPMFSTSGGITGAANVTGAKYIAQGNGVIQSGARGVGYLPGSSPGVLNTGGQYQ
jgi:hypothetical protein